MVTMATFREILRIKNKNILKRLTICLFKELIPVYKHLKIHNLWEKIVLHHRCSSHLANSTLEPSTTLIFQQVGLVLIAVVRVLSKRENNCTKPLEA